MSYIVALSLVACFSQSHAHKSCVFLAAGLGLSWLTSCLSSGSCSCTTVALSLLLNQTQLSLQRDDPGLVVVWSQLLSVFSHCFIAVVLQLLRECSHRRVELIIGQLARANSRRGVIVLLKRGTSNRSRWSLNGFWLSSKIHFLTFLYANSFRRFAPNSGSTSILHSFRVITSTTDFPVWLNICASSILVLLGSLLFWFLNFRLSSVRLHDIVDQVIKFLFVNLFVAYLLAVFKLLF